MMSDERQEMHPARARLQQFYKDLHSN